MAKIAVVLFLAFVVVLAALVAAAVAYNEGFTRLPFESHEPIFIDGNEDFLRANGVVSGSGIESNPYVIEGWSIQTSADRGISISNTDAYLVIRNVSVESSSYSYGNEVGAGLILNNASNVKIESIVVFAFRVGVLLNGSADAWCENLTISQSRLSSNTYQVVVRNTTNLDINRLITQPYYYDSGILLDNCTDFDVRSNIIQNYGIDYVSRAAFGICVGNSSNGRLADNLIRWPDTYNAKGIWIRNSTAVSITNNSIVDAREMSIWVETSGDLSVVKNTIEGWDNSGILILYSSGFLVADNKFCKSWRQSSASLGASHSENGTIRNNSLIECGGIGAYECRNIFVSDNLVDRAGFSGSGYTITGLSVQGTNITVSRNVVTEGLTTGIRIQGDNITVADNEVSNNCRNVDTYPAAGVLASGKNLTVVGNEIRNNTHGDYWPAGVLLETSENSTFRENNVSDALNVFYCGYIDVTANHFYGNWNFTFFDAESSANISFFGNSFFDDINAHDYMASGVLLWDAGYPTGGNYWSNYTGVDLKSGPNQNQPGADGVGDTPYEHSPGEWDNFPLMMPTTIADLTAPITFAYLSGELGTLGWYRSSVNVTLNSADARGSVNATRYSLNGGLWELYTSGFQITGKGNHSLEFYSVDIQGNRETTKTVEIWIDSVKPYPLPAMKTEYKFRGVETGYVYPLFEDNTSTIIYFGGIYAVESFMYYTSCPYVSVSLYEDMHEYRIWAFDAAGNSFSQNISIQTVLHPNTELLSLGGPYGPLYAVALATDIGLLIAALVVFEMSRDRPPNRPAAREEGERHYDEDVIDGYPKFMRKA